MMGKKLERQGEKYRIWIVTTLFAGACISVCYFHVILRIGTIITHIFYVPIILAAVWWNRKGLLVALFSSGFLIFSHVFLRPDVATHNDYVRALMFIVTAFVVAELSRRIAKEEEALQESEQRLRVIFDNAVDGILVADVENKKFTIGNKAICQMLGYNKEEIENLTVTNIHPEEDLPYVIEQFEKQAKRERLLAKDIPVKRKNGDVFYADINSFPIALGGRTYLMGVFRDITDRKKAEEVLRESENSYRAVVENAVEGIVVVQGQTLQFVNPALVSMIGYSKQELLTRPFIEFIHPDHREWAMGIHIKRLKGEEVPPIYEFKAIDKKGNTRWIENNGILINWGNKPATLNFLRDITERKKAEQAIWASESEKKSILNALSDIVLFQDTDLTIRWCNEAATRSLGMTQRELIGCYCYELWHGRSEPCEQCPVLRAIETRSHTEGIITTSDGKWWEVIGEPVCDRDGEIRGAIEIARDITERKKAEEEIRKLSTAVEQSIDGIAIGDLELKLIYVNDAFARMHGYAPEDMVGMPITNLHSKEQMDEYKKKLNQLKTQDSWEGEIGHIRKDGTAFPTYASFTLLKNSKGKPTRTLAIARDITESKRREEELNMSIYSEKMARAEQLASLGTLSATVAHELTQPLTVISLSIENALAKLEATSSPETVIRKLNDSLTEISNITSIVERFRNFARRSSDEIVKEIEFGVVGERVVKLLNESARRAEIVLSLNGMDKLPLVYSNEKDMEQLFFALADNAIQAADGKKSRQLIISGAVKNEYIELSFSDNCGGVAPEDIDKIFEPFFTTKPKGQGTGLGLCIVQSIVSRAGGKIRVESKFSEGSTFFVTLPINKSTKS